MDRPNLSATIRRELGDLFMATLAQMGPELRRADLDGIEQRLPDLARRVFGPVVEAVVEEIAAREGQEPPRCATCARALRRVDPARPRPLQGLVGDYTLVRPSFACPSCHHGTAPLDARLGSGAGALSPGLARGACRRGMEDSFGEAADALPETLRVGVPREAIRRATEGIGQVAEDEEQAAIRRAEAGREPLRPASDLPIGAALLVEVDGAMVHLDDDGHEVKVGLAAPLGPRTHADPETGHETLVMGQPGYCAGFEPAEAFGYRVYGEACRQGLGSAGLAVIVVLGDGADWIWRHAARFLAIGAAQIIEIVDIDPAWEHLGTVAAAVFGPGPPAAFAGVEPLQAKLRDEGAGPLLAALTTLAPADPRASEEVRRAIGYFTAHAERMNYPRFRADHLPIGSGAVESGGQTLVEEREKGAGMRWLQEDAQAVASLRALWRSGRWTTFWHTHPQCRRPPVARRRPPPRTRPALKQAA